MSDCPSGADPKTCGADPNSCPGCSPGHQEVDPMEQEIARTRKQIRRGQEIDLRIGNVRQPSGNAVYSHLNPAQA